MQEHHFDTLISGRYRLLRRLQRGGMSEVFLALDEQEQRQVAIKIVMSDDAECIKRLQREVHILRQLSHPHILPLLDDGISGSYYYLVMPYMHRGNLRERMSRNKLTPQEVGIILQQLADALACAHTYGVVHRDIKPSNILLDADDASHIYLADFGLAKIVEQGSDITQTGFLVGTPEYMAPELAEEPESASSDIYAIGVLLYQALTGRLPFTGLTPLAICWKHIKEQPAPPSSLNPEISPAIERVILRAMHKNPRLRFPDAEALSLAYDKALSGVDEMPDLSPVSPVDAPVLPPPQVTLSRAKKGFAAGRRQPRIGKAVQRGAVGIAAAALLALPVSLGFMVAHAGAGLQSPLALSQPATVQRGTTMAGKVVSSQLTTMPAGGATLSVVSTVINQPKTDLSTHIQVEPNNQKQGHGHKHKHKHQDD